MSATTQSRHISERVTVLWSRGVIALLGPALFLYFFRGLEADRLYTIAGALAGATATLLGFLITAVSILTALMNRRLLQNMRRTGHYRRLVLDTFLSCALLFATLIICIVSMFLGGVPLIGTFSVMLFFALLSFLYVAEAGHRFYTIIKLI